MWNVRNKEWRGDMPNVLVSGRLLHLILLSIISNLGVIFSVIFCVLVFCTSFRHFEVCLPFIIVVRQCLPDIFSSRES